MPRARLRPRIAELTRKPTQLEAHREPSASTGAVSGPRSTLPFCP